MATIPFIAYEISGVKQPAYGSGAANKTYVDSKFAEVVSDSPQNWTTLTAGTGLLSFEGGIGVSGSTPVSLDVAGYSTISSNAHKAQASSQIAFYESSDVDHDATTNFVANEHVDHSSVSISNGTGITGGGDLTSTRTISVLGYSTISSQAKSWNSYLTDSGSKLHSAYLSASTGVFALDTVSLTAGNGLTGGGTLEANRTFTVGAGTGITVNADDVAVTDYTKIVSNALSGQVAQKHLLDSGAKYHGAYLSGAALRNGGRKTVASGWSTITNGEGTADHNLGVIPTAHGVTPSGLVAFAVATKLTTSQILIYITAAGSRCVHWRAEV